MTCDILGAIIVDNTWTVFPNTVSILNGINLSINDYWKVQDNSPIQMTLKTENNGNYIDQIKKLPVKPK